MRPCFTVLNGPKPNGEKWFSVANETAAGPVLINIYGPIGSSLWDEAAVGAREFSEALNTIPAGRQIEIHVNCPGGNVWDGIAIHSLIAARKQEIVTVIDGLAASTGGWAFLAAREVRMSRNAHLMMHNPSAPMDGTEDQHTQAAELLKRAKETITNIFASKSGKDKARFAELMNATSWLTADQAKAEGLCDVITDGVYVQNTFDLSGFSNVPEALNNRVAKAPPTNGGEVKHTMKREKMIALLNKHGIKFAADATDEQLTNLLDTIPAPVAPEVSNAGPANAAELASLRSDVQALRNSRDNERKARITAAVDSLVNSAQIPGNQRDAWVTRVLNDETMLEVANALPVVKPGIDPLAPSAEVVSDNVADIGKHIVSNLWGKTVDAIEAARARSTARAGLIIKNIGKLVQLVQNSNTVPTELKRAVLLQQMITDFSLRLIAVKSCCSSLNAIPLEGTDKVIVPFYDLESAASVDFDEDEGYQMGDTTTTTREVTINKRKYQSMAWSSKELRRQPFLNLLQLSRLKAAKLGVDVVTDWLSLVKAAKFPTVAHTGAAADFTSDSVAALKGKAKLWPEVGRSLFIDSDYDAKLLTDASIKSALASGTTDALREGKVGKRLMGFDYNENPNIPDNGENLRGWICFMSCMLFAQAPIQPTDEVRNLLTRYEIVTDPESGVSFEYRLWGNADMDGSREVIECNYGFDVGNAKALQRIRSAA